MVCGCRRGSTARAQADGAHDLRYAALRDANRCVLLWPPAAASRESRLGQPASIKESRVSDRCESGQRGCAHQGPRLPSVHLFFARQPGTLMGTTAPAIPDLSNDWHPRSAQPLRAILEDMQLVAVRVRKAALISWRSGRAPWPASPSAVEADH